MTRIAPYLAAVAIGVALAFAATWIFLSVFTLDIPVL